MRRLAIPVALLAVAACSEGGDPVQMALRDASAARQAAALKETAEVAPPATAAGNRDMADGDAAYVTGMIEHHRAAMTLAVDALARSEDPEIRRMAQAEIETRSREIAALQAWTPTEQDRTQRFVSAR